MAHNGNMDDEELDKEPSAISRISFVEVFYDTLRHWPWLLLSVAICVGLGCLYVLRTPKTYTQSADLLIKEEENGQSAATGALANLSSLGIVKTNSNIINEVTNLQSRDLMEEAVRRLGVDRSIYRKGFFKKTLLYGLDLPVNVALSNVNEETQLTFDLKVDRNGNVTISDVVSQQRKNGNRGSYKPKQKFDGDYKGKLNAPIKTPAGTVTVSATDFYNPEENLDLYFEKLPVSNALLQFNKRLGTELVEEDGTVIHLTLSDQSDQRANDLLNTLIGVYNEQWIIDKNKIANSTEEFINERLVGLEADLGNVDNDISSFKSANLVVDKASQVYLQQGEKTAEDIMKIGNALQMSQYIRFYLSQPENYDKLLPANTGIDNPAIEQQIAEYNRMMLQREGLANKSSDQNPLVVNADKQLESQRRAIVTAVDNQVYGLQAQLSSARRASEQNQSRIASEPRQSKYLLSVERQQKVKEELYIYLLQKREENQLTKAFSASNTRLVNRPGDSGVPPKPAGMMVLGLSFILGLMIPFVVTYIRELNNTKVRTRKDVENLKLPFLGEIPRDYDTRRHKGNREVVVKEGNRNVINEAFRVLRTNVEFMKKGKGCDVIAVTSFNAHSGKSYISINLGKALSLKGKRVLVIDGDMRHGSTSEYVGSPAKGISGLLNGGITDPQSVIVPVGDSSNLFVLPVGAVPPNPAELLERPAFGQLIEDLRPEYDYIIIDCPPIEVVADAQIINKCADSTIFVLRSGLLERSMLPVLEKMYDEKKYVDMSMILNDTPVIKNAFGAIGHKGYGYGYGYGYDYGTKE